MDRRLLAAAHELRGKGERAVLATLVAVEGSSVRRPGAHLLLRADGSAEGFLSAGCVERDLQVRVERVLGAGRPEVVRYRPEDVADPILGLGLGCGGGMTVLLEPWPPASGPDPVELAGEVHRTRRPAALATVVSPAEAMDSRAGITRSGTVEAAGRAALTPLLEDLARTGLEGTAGLRRTGELEVFVERFEPPFRVLVQGLTPPALSLARLADALGWEVVLLATGPGPANPRLPEGTVVLEAGPGPLPAGFEPDPWTAAVLLAHDTGAEARVLPALLAGETAYIGVMGSRRRRRELLGALQAAGVPEELAARIHMPVGLDIGTESAPEIALAAAAEILAVRRGRGGGRLAPDRPVHDR